MKLSFGNRKEKRRRRAVTGRWWRRDEETEGRGGCREGGKSEDKSTSSHADLKKHCAPSHPCWRPYGRNNKKKEVNREGGGKFAFLYLRGVDKWRWRWWMHVRVSVASLNGSLLLHGRNSGILTPPLSSPSLSSNLLACSSHWEKCPRLLRLPLCLDWIHLGWLGICLH